MSLNPNSFYAFLFNKNGPSLNEFNSFVYLQLRQAFIIKSRFNAYFCVRFYEFKTPFFFCSGDSVFMKRIMKNLKNDKKALIFDHF